MLYLKPIHILFSIGPFKVYTWGLIAALAFLISTLLAANSAKKQKKDPDKIYNIAFYALIGAILGARLLFVLLNLNYYLQYPIDIFKLWDGGLVSYGGLFLAILFVYIYIKKNKIDFYEYADLIAPYIALGFFIGRIGCFLNWDDYGTYTNLPWAVKVSTDLPRHPTQLYLSLANLLIFTLLKVEKIKLKKLKKGFLFLSFLIFYAIFRFSIDFFREYTPNTRLFSQLTCLSIIIFAIFLIFKKGKTQKKKPLKIKTCPNCKSKNITPYMGFQFGKYHCKDCNYIGPLIIEKTLK